MFLHDYLLACEISTVRTQTLKQLYSTFFKKNLIWYIDNAYYTNESNFDKQIILGLSMHHL